MEKHGRVLADRIEEDRALELRCYLPENMDALGFKPIKMVRVHVVACSNIGQGPLAPFQRQAMSSSPVCPVSHERVAQL